MQGKHLHLKHTARRIGCGCRPLEVPQKFKRGSDCADFAVPESAESVLKSV